MQLRKVAAEGAHVEFLCNPLKANTNPQSNGEMLKYTGMKISINGEKCAACALRQGSSYYERSKYVGDVKQKFLLHLSLTVY